MKAGWTVTVLAALSAAAVALPAQAQHLLRGNPPRGPCSIRATVATPSDPPIACMRAIADAGGAYEKADLYFYWAYALNDVGNYEAALPNLDAAIKLAPDFVNAYYERSFTHGLLGNFTQALADADAAVKLQPDHPQMLRQRAIARFFVSDFAGELADCQRGIALGSPDPLLLVCQAEALVGLGRYGEAEKVLAKVPANLTDARIDAIRGDVQRMKRFKPKGNAAARCIDVRTLSPANADAKIADCSAALLQERDRTKRADYLLYRSIARYLLDRTPGSNLIDLGLAAAIDPGAPNVHVNYAAALNQAERFQSARSEYTKALASGGLTPDNRVMALSGRAQANLALGALDAAWADAKASDELDPSAGSREQLGNIAMARGDKGAAKTYWLSAWRSGGRGDDLRSKLRRVGVDDPDQALRK